MRIHIPLGATKQMTVVDKGNLDLPIRTLRKESLPIVCVPRTNVDQPSVPQTPSIFYAVETGAK